MKRYSILLLVTYSLLTSSFVSASDASAMKMLDRISHSSRELNYRGTFSFQQGDTMESLRIAHAVIDGEEYERLEYMDGKKREIIRRGHPLSCVHPGHQLVQFYGSKRGPELGSGGSQGGIANYYQVSLAGTGRVAGHNVLNLDVSPKDTHRYGYRLSLDEASGLLLRAEMIGARDKVLERFQFVEVAIGEPMQQADFPAGADSYQAHHLDPIVGQSLSAASDKGWKVQWLPTGFTSAVANMNVISGDMATFTDGLAVFSVFIESDVDAATIERGVEGNAQRGATTAYSRALLLAGRPHRVTVVGEIPAQTAREIAQSIILVE